MVEHRGDALDDCEAEAKPFFDIRLLGLEAVKFPEDVAEILFRNADPGIPDLDPQHRAAPTAANQDSAPPRIADRVRKKILQDATQQGRIASHARLRSAHLEGKTALAGDRVEFLGEGRQYLVDAKGGESRPYGA